jgi:hypothetical protein
MNLLELSKSLESTLAQLQAARSGARDGEAIDRRTKQWSTELADLQSANQRAIWLSVELSKLPSFPEQFAYTRQLARQAAERLDERPDVEVLIEEDLWVRLLQTTQKTAATAWTEVKRAWAWRVEEFNQLTLPQQLRVTASPLPQNAELLTKYEENFRAASRFAAMESPKTADQPASFVQAIDTCRSLAAQLSFDAPAEVEEFFRAISAGSASLALVTPSVLAWLAENDQLSRYGVRSSGR